MNEHPAGGKLSLSESAKREMALIGKWSRYIAVSGFIIGGLIILFGVFAGLITFGLFSLGLDKETLSNLPSWLGIVLYIVVVGAYFVPFILLYNFGIKVKAAILFDSEQMLTTALNHLHQCFRFMALITVTLVALFVLVRIGIAIAFIAGLV